MLGRALEADEAANQRVVAPMCGALVVGLEQLVQAVLRGIDRVGARGDIDPGAPKACGADGDQEGLWGLTAINQVPQPLRDEVAAGKVLELHASMIRVALRAGPMIAGQERWTISGGAQDSSRARRTASAS